MKISPLLTFIFLSIVALCSCSKSNTTPSDPIVTHDTVVSIIRDTIVSIPPNAIVGLWIGSQIPNDGSTTVPLYYSFEIKSDSTLLVQGQGADGNTYYSVGKWSLTGTAFTATINVTNFSQAGVKQNITAVYNNTSGKLTSGIVQTVGVIYTASFTLDRVN
ncbi:MAG TPA: hypothetical protein VK622_09160 [Puia sp.]|nr:hypothetical protein [Puia sp.]